MKVNIKFLRGFYLWQLLRNTGFTGVRGHNRSNFEMGAQCSVRCEIVAGIFRNNYETMLVDLLCGKDQCWKKLNDAAVLKDSPAAYACLAVAYAKGMRAVSTDMAAAKVFADFSLDWLKQNDYNPFKLVLKGLFHQYGLGSDKSNEEAQNCFQNVNNNGLALYCANKLACSAEFPDRSPDFIEAFPYLRDSAILGFDRAQFELARAFEYGKGTASNVAEARKWYKIAVKNKVKGAANGLKRCRIKNWKLTARFYPEFRAFINSSALWTTKCTGNVARFCI